jgi:hypothetical protein
MDIVATFSTALPASLTSTAHIVPPIGDFFPTSIANISPLSRPASAMVRLDVPDWGEMSRPARLGRSVEGSLSDLRAGRVDESDDEDMSMVHKRVSDSIDSSDRITLLSSCDKVDRGVSLGHEILMGDCAVTGPVVESGSIPVGR